MLETIEMQQIFELKIFFTFSFLNTLLSMLKYLLKSIQTEERKRITQQADSLIRELYFCHPQHTQTHRHRQPPPTHTPHMHHFSYLWIQIYSHLQKPFAQVQPSPTCSTWWPVWDIPKVALWWPSLGSPMLSTRKRPKHRQKQSAKLKYFDSAAMSWYCRKT